MPTTPGAGSVASGGALPPGMRINANGKRTRIRTIEAECVRPVFPEAAMIKLLLAHKLHMPLHFAPARGQPILDKLSTKVRLPWVCGCRSWPRAVCGVTCHLPGAALAASAHGSLCGLCLVCRGGGCVVVGLAPQAGWLTAEGLLGVLAAAREFTVYENRAPYFFFVDPYPGVVLLIAQRTFTFSKSQVVRATASRVDPASLESFRHQRGSVLRSGWMHKDAVSSNFLVRMYRLCRLPHTAGGEPRTCFSRCVPARGR